MNMWALVWTFALLSVTHVSAISDEERAQICADNNCQLCLSPSLVCFSNDRCAGLERFGFAACFLAFDTVAPTAAPPQLCDPCAVNATSGCVANGECHPEISEGDCLFTPGFESYCSGCPSPFDSDALYLPEFGYADVWGFDPVMGDCAGQGTCEVRCQEGFSPADDVELDDNGLPIMKCMWEQRQWSYGRCEREWHQKCWQFDEEEVDECNSADCCCYAGVIKSVEMAPTVGMGGQDPDNSLWIPALYQFRLDEMFGYCGFSVETTSAQITTQNPPNDNVIVYTKVEEYGDLKPQTFTWNTNTDNSLSVDWNRIDDRCPTNVYPLQRAKKIDCPVDLELDQVQALNDLYRLTSEYQGGWWKRPRPSWEYDVNAVHGGWPSSSWCSFRGNRLISVRCNSLTFNQGFVTAISLRNNRLKGRLDGSCLDGQNQECLAGVFRRWPQLQYLDLNFNELYTLPYIFKPGLTGDNRFPTGGLPAWQRQDFPELRKFRMLGNAISGTWPAEWALWGRHTIETIFLTGATGGVNGVDGLHGIVGPFPWQYSRFTKLSDIIAPSQHIGGPLSKVDEITYKGEPEACGCPAGSDTCNDCELVDGCHWQDYGECGYNMTGGPGPLYVSAGGEAGAVECAELCNSHPVMPFYDPARAQIITFEDSFVTDTIPNATCIAWEYEPATGLCCLKPSDKYYVDRFAYATSVEQEQAGLGHALDTTFKKRVCGRRSQMRQFPRSTRLLHIGRNMMGSWLPAYDADDFPALKSLGLNDNEFYLGAVPPSLSTLPNLKAFNMARQGHQYPPLSFFPDDNLAFCDSLRDPASNYTSFVSANADFAEAVMCCEHPTVCCAPGSCKQSLLPVAG